MKLVILTGMSGAGKSTALKMMEDIRFYCVDNLPIPLIEKFIELADLRNTELQKVAVGVDIRSGQALEDLQDIQAKIYEHRKGCFAIPNFFYNIFKDNDEDNAHRAALRN